jgi:hypothetical protein
MLKKGQVTLFIIVGIVIIIAASFFLYYRTLLLPGVEFVPDDAMPVKNYVESCLSSVGEKAIILLGMQSGYIKIPDQVKLNQLYIEFAPNSQMQIPYWEYNSQSFIPTIESMQDDISSYIKDNMDKCLDFTVFKDSFSIEQQNQTEIETVIADDNVDISLSYGLVLTSKLTDEQTKISKFHSSIPVKLKQAYELGKKILEAEDANMYLENITIDWLSMNPKIPLNGIEFHCSDLKWRVSDVKDQIQQTIYYNIPSLMVKDTDHPAFLENDSVYEKLRTYTLEDINKGKYPDIKTPDDAYDYSHYLLDVRTDPTTLKAGFFYNPVWGMDLTARPSENGIMKSNKQEGSEEFLSFMCLNVYHFNYDVVYPIEVLIRDDSAFNGAGYVFRYGFQVMVNHNKPDRKGFLNPEFNMVGTHPLGECEGLAGPTYDIRAIGLDEYGIANMELKDVNITYDCYKFNCFLGQTEADQGSYRLRTKLPVSCSNGFIVAQKPGYLWSRQQVLDSTDIDANMRKTKTLDFEVVSNTYNSLNGNINDNLPISKPFAATIDLQSIDVPSFSQSKRFPFDETNQDNKIDLIEQDSSYRLQIYLFDEADGVLIGGYENNITLRYDDIANSNKIVFHAASYLPKPISPDQQNQIYTFLEQNNIYKDRLKPELTR